MSEREAIRCWDEAWVPFVWPNCSFGSSRLDEELLSPLESFSTDVRERSGPSGLGVERASVCGVLESLCHAERCV
jgi:hypothetical protein